MIGMIYPNLKSKLLGEMFFASTIKESFADVDDDVTSLQPIEFP
jgi:hypothetical protein